jgi:probable O-glycosylation ligase (exosortase A-associated)
LRSIFLFGAFFAALPFALLFPYVGLLIWSWFAFMNPHRETFGLSYDFSFNFIVAGMTILAWLLSSEPKRLPIGPFTILLFIFAIWASVTTYFAINFDHSYYQWDRFMKSAVLAVAVATLATTKVRVQALVWVICISLGYYAVKGAGFLLLTGGAFRVFGPAESHIADNNHLALALVLTMPLLGHLYFTSARATVRLACLVVGAMAILTVVGTYSRGGLLGLVTIATVFLLMSRHRFKVLAVAVAVFLFLPQIMPPAWYQRMATIQGYEEDASVQSRFAAWMVAWNMARERPLTGGGFSATEVLDTYARYKRAPGGELTASAAHSIYFQVLGDHGFIGLLIYLALLTTPFRSFLRVMGMTRDRSDLAWANSLARASVIGLIGFVVAGMALSMAYYDVFLAIAALAMALERQIGVAVAESEPASASSPAAPPWRGRGIRIGT